MNGLTRLAAFLTCVALVACGGGGGGHAAVSIKVDGGDAQSATAGTSLPQPLTVRVVNALGEPIAGLAIGFAVAQGGGEVVDASSATDPDGRAMARWRLGTISGPQSLAVSVVSPAGEVFLSTISAVALPGPPAVLRLMSGDLQRTERARAFPDPVVVLVADTFGNAVPGVEVRFIAQPGAGVTPATASTDAAGTAATTWTSAPVTGEQLLEVRTVLLPGLVVHGTASAGLPAAITTFSGSGQTVTQHTEPAERLEVTVTDFLGDPVEGVEVEFRAAPGSGTIDNEQPLSTTDAQGHAAWHGGAIHSAGEQPISATIKGSPAAPALFTFTVTPAGSAFEGGFALTVDDGSGANALPSAVVTFRNGVLKTPTPGQVLGFNWGLVDVLTGEVSMTESLPSFNNQYYTGVFVVQPDGGVVGSGTWLVASIFSGPTGARGTWTARKVFD